VRDEPPRIEEVAKELYIRALKQLPHDIKSGFDIRDTERLKAAFSGASYVFHTATGRWRRSQGPA